MSKWQKLGEETCALIRLSVLQRITIQLTLCEMRTLVNIFNNVVWSGYVFFILLFSCGCSVSCLMPASERELAVCDVTISDQSYISALYGALTYKLPQSVSLWDCTCELHLTNKRSCC